MDAQGKFSNRSDIRKNERAIVVREDAPTGLRTFIIKTVSTFVLSHQFLRDSICEVLHIPPLESGCESHELNKEAYDLIYNCQWYYVYDLIELIHMKLYSPLKEQFKDRLNYFFSINGYGYKLVNNSIEVKGDEVFEISLENVVHVLENGNLQTAKQEIREAIQDLSRRPTADITGAIQHSMACLECVAREVSGDRNLTLGALLKKNPHMLPATLKEAVDKIWGFASEQGRHLKEGNPPDYLEAELVVHLCAAASTYLAGKLQAKKTT